MENQESISVVVGADEVAKVKVEEVIEKEEVVTDSKTSEEQVLANVIRSEGPFEVTINGRLEKMYWAKTGYGDRISFRAYFKKKLKEYIKDGIISVEDHYVGKPTGDLDGKNTTFGLKPASIVDGTLKVFYDKALMVEGRDYTYASDYKAIFFNEAPYDDVTVEYDYYDEEIYNELFQTISSVIMIYLSARKADRVNERYFASPIDINRLSLIEVSEMLTMYNKFNPTESQLKK